MFECGWGVKGSFRMAGGVKEYLGVVAALKKVGGWLGA